MLTAMPASTSNSLTKSPTSNVAGPRSRSTNYIEMTAALAVGAAAILATSAPAFAGETLTIRSTMIADIGRDTIDMSKPKDTAPKIVSAAPADYPEIERELEVRGHAVIAVELSADGKLTKATIFKTSGNRRLDQSALYAVGTAKYQPGTVAGTAVGGTYAVDVDFDSEN